MDIALYEARRCAEIGEVPVGAVVVLNREVVAAAGNAICGPKDPTGHAEIIALRQAAQTLGEERLTDCDLYVTLEPCTMCAGAISLARIRRLYYGASDEKGGAVEHGVQFFRQATCHHAPEVYSGFLETDCARLLKEFFKKKR